MGLGARDDPFERTPVPLSRLFQPRQHLALNELIFGVHLEFIRIVWRAFGLTLVHLLVCDSCSPEGDLNYPREENTE